MPKKYGADLTIILPMAGIGRRMRSQGAKPLIELFGKATVLNYQITLLRKIFPRSEIIIVVGFQAERIIKLLDPADKIKVVENELYETTGILRSIDLALKASSHTNVLIIYGDLIFNEPTLANINNGCSAVIVDNKGQFNKEEVGLTIVNGEATYFAYGLDTKWAQIAFLTGKPLRDFKDILTDRAKRKLQPFEIFNMIIEKGTKFKVIEPKGMKIVEIDCQTDIERARKVI